MHPRVEEFGEQEGVQINTGETEVQLFHARVS